MGKLRNPEIHEKVRDALTHQLKETAKSCEDIRTISLMCHVLKVFFKIILARIYKEM